MKNCAIWRGNTDGELFAASAEGKSNSTTTPASVFARFSFGKKSREGTRSRRARTRFGQTDLARLTPRFDGFAKSVRHPAGIGRYGDGRVHENSVGSHFHRFGRLAGCAKTGVHDDRHRGLFDNDLNL